MGQLQKIWCDSFVNLDAQVPSADIFVSLIGRYREPHRKYHTVQHLNECFAWYERVSAFLIVPGEIAIALFYHDAIYNIPGLKNEADSATLVRQTLSGCLPALTLKNVETMILATAHVDLGASLTSDTMHMLDIDMSILGADPVRFNEYEQQIREEYATIPEEQFRRGRAAVLRRFLAWESIYQTDFFKKLLESKARENIARSLKQLEIPDS